MKRKLLSVLLSALLLVAYVPLGAIPVFAATSGTTGDCTWTLNGTELTISGNGAMEDYAEMHQVSDTLISTSIWPTPWGEDITSVTIENGVTTIGGGAFYDCSKLTSVTIGNNVISVGQYAFGSCTSLAAVTIPDSVITIERYAFDSCRALKKVTIGNSVTTIHSRAFEYCRSLTAISVDENNPNYSSLDGVLFDKKQTALIWFPRTKSGAYTIPDSVTTIGTLAFECCTSLTAVDIPDSVTTIGTRAFECCTSLTAVDIPDSVTTIGTAAFADCESLTAISVDENNPSYSSVDGVLFDKDQTALIIFPGCSGKTEYTIPDSVITIGAQAFHCCTSLTSVTIPDSVTSIGDAAFGGCYNLVVVYYNGTEENRANIEIGYGNDDLLNAIWYYSYDGHVYDDCWDLDCNKCGEVRDVPGHWYELVCDCDPTCGMEGVAEYICVYCCHCYADITPATGEHTYDHECDPECNTCGFTREVGDHIYDNDCDPDCIFCGFVREVGDHVYENDCDADCNVCGWIREVGDHFYDSDCDANCGFCGYVREVGDHTYDDEYDADCNVCGLIRQVPEKPVIHGDANGDGAINARDVALLQQYIVGWDVTPDEAAADANGDGAINARDVALLQQYIVGWDVTLG